MRLRYLLASAVLLLSGTTAAAHRVGESYIYVDVTDDEMIGRFHIRLADVTKAVNLDENGDGVVDEAEFDAKSAAVYDHLVRRLTFVTDGTAHKVQISGHKFFGPENARQANIRFDIPTLGPPPESLEVEYRFLYDGADPAHRPMLLQASNTRLRLEQNESVVSLVFEPNAERHVLSLMPRPRAEIFGSFLLHGAFEILSSPVRILFAIALFLPVVMLRSGNSWTAGQTSRTASIAAAKTSTLFAFGFLGALAFPAFQLIVPSKEVGQALFALSIILLAIDNFRPLPYLRRADVAIVLGLLQGLGVNGFKRALGLDKGFVEIALAGFGVGTWLAMALIAAVVIPLLSLVRREAPYQRLALRYSFVPLMIGAVFWFV